MISKIFTEGFKTLLVIVLAVCIAGALTAYIIGKIGATP